MMLPVCKFSGLTIWNWTVSSCALPWGTPPLPFSALVSCCSFCVGLRHCGLFPIQFGMFAGVILVQFMFEKSCWWGFIGVASDVTERQKFIALSPILWLLHSFFLSPLSQGYSNIRYESSLCIVYILWNWAHNSEFFIVCVFLSLDERGKLHLSMGIRMNTFNFAVRDYPSLVN